jgi:hypothetical protein
MSQRPGGKFSNVFSSLSQYTAPSGKHLIYKITAGTPQTDTHAFPTNGCTPDSGRIWSDGTGYSHCITNAQLLNEALAFLPSKSLPTNDLAHLYLYFLPKGVETCFSSINGAGGGSCSINANPGFCGYHAFGSPPLVADMNYAVVDSPLGWTCSSDAGSNTGGNQTPNNNIDADSEISITSHEIIETITDPQGNAWFDSSGTAGEIGDDCAYIFGDSLSFQGSAGHRYNQAINAHHYFIQLEFSNRDYAKNPALSCIGANPSATVAPTSGPPGTAVTVTGGGWASGETVKLTYATKLTSPSTVVICSAVATGTGAISCTGHIPGSSTAGPTGAHTLTAKGATSPRQATTKFTRT